MRHEMLPFECLNDVVTPYTMLTPPRLANLYAIARGLVAEGALVECGVWNGGSAAMMAMGSPERDLWLLDSWEGLPLPGPEDVINKPALLRGGACKGDELQVARLLLGVLGFAPSRLHMIKGWYADVLPSVCECVGQVAMLHLDCDFYDSVSLCLTHLWPLVAADGVVVVDDYGHFPGCRKAVDSFFAGQGVMPRLRPVDYTAVNIFKAEVAVAP